jgi:hypothetical protein
MTVVEVSDATLAHMLLVSVAYFGAILNSLFLSEIEHHSARSASL